MADHADVSHGFVSVNMCLSYVYGKAYGYAWLHVNDVEHGAICDKNMIGIIVGPCSALQLNLVLLHCPRRSFGTFLEFWRILVCI